MALKVPLMTSGNNRAIGSVEQSMLSETQFQLLNGTGWILADGRNVAGSVYATVLGVTNVPDLRGVTLRGKNNGRVDGNQNPDGDVALGTFQGHAFTSHSHTINLHGNVPAVTANPAASSAAFSGHQHASSAPNTGGGNETRMRNVTINQFIKINP